VTVEVLIAWIAHRTPKFPRTGHVRCHQNACAFHTPRGKNRFDLPDKLSCDALSSAIWANHKAVHIASPAIKGADQRSNDVAVFHCQQEHSGWMFHNAT
jgi:hypothetical protein